MNSHTPDVFHPSNAEEQSRSHRESLDSRVDMVDPELALEQILADPDFLQHVIRRREDDLESFVGYFRCQFLPKQQRYVLHVPFSPSLPTLPAVDAMIADECEARVRVTDRQKFGVRMEIVLPIPAETELALLVEVIATASTK